jgi:hypothetical protein
MKKLYSAISSLALLFSLPAIAAPMAKKALDEASSKDGISKTASNVVTIYKLGPTDTMPPCRGGGGG